MLLPDHWPDGKFELVVFSEIAYYLEERDKQSVFDHRNPA
jgi:hypothetical protein